jgi:predicted nucleotidyltransferase component of viral defense system
LKDSRFYPEAALMLHALSAVAGEQCFALKGGTAINFFVRDLPRLSVDVDLTYVLVQERDESLNGISDALRRIAAKLRERPFSLRVHESTLRETGHCTKLLVSNGSVQVKIEPNLVIRGTVHPPEIRELGSTAQELFELAVSVPVVSLPDLYGGKICAALDRQHPRDLFDMKLELEAEGITDAMRKGFLVYLISHDRPISELINPTRLDRRDLFANEFRGMAREAVTYEALVDARERMIATLADSITAEERQFLMSFKEGKPDWQLLGLNGVDRLPAVRWKLLNIGRMKPPAHAEALKKLKGKLGL